MLSTENETKQTFCLSFTDCSMCFLFSSRFRLKSEEVNKKLMSIPDKKAKAKRKSMDGNSIKCREKIKVMNKHAGFTQEQTGRVGKEQWRWNSNDVDNGNDEDEDDDDTDDGDDPR